MQLASRREDTAHLQSLSLADSSLPKVMDRGRIRKHSDSD